MKGQIRSGVLVFLGVLVFGGILCVRSYNGLVRLHEQIPAAWGQVENVLQRRNDLIPNLVNTVKGYAKHEQSVFADVSAALASFSRAKTVSEKIEADNTLSGLLHRLMAISVNYPTLKANENFSRLQDELAGTENRIAVERMRYNDVVQTYNAKVKTFPTNIVAKFGNLAPSEDYFKAVPAAQAVPQVQF